MYKRKRTTEVKVQLIEDAQMMEYRCIPQSGKSQFYLDRLAADVISVVKAPRQAAAPLTATARTDQELPRPSIAESRA